MNNLYLITTAIKQNHVPYSVFNGRFCITSTTELEAAAIALANQPKNTYIFSIEVYLAQKYLHILHKAGSERVNPSIQSVQDSSTNNRSRYESG